MHQSPTDPTPLCPLRSSRAGHHADPNLTYARDICDVMGVDKTGAAMPLPEVL